MTIATEYVTKLKKKKNEHRYIILDNILILLIAKTDI